ncbi:MAG: hypothetical protein GY783_18530 [Gammaproteobacteria bacterium]|nr:hypothetical protein [Gammaproteobacteria bacterium]
MLLPKSAVVPAGVDFSGLWQLHVDPDSKPIALGRSQPGIRLPAKNTSRNAGRRPSKRSSGSAVHVFLETGESLKISQTRDGLFISFDRAIVEEYRFGEDRIVSVGPIEAQRVSGWEEGVFVVETLDEQGVVLTESWRLDAGGDVLVRDISVAEGSDKQFSSQQRFDRI